MSASTSISHPSSTALTGRLAAGAAGGLAGGVVFGILMQLGDMIPMVAMLVDSEAVAVGWVVHLAISVFLGALFAVVIGHRGGGPARSVGLGAAWGVLWWVLGALVLMPARLGMDLFMLNEMTLRSLMGHVIFGVLLGAVVALLARRTTR